MENIKTVYVVIKEYYNFNKTKVIGVFAEEKEAKKVIDLLHTRDCEQLFGEDGCYYYNAIPFNVNLLLN